MSDLSIAVILHDIRSAHNVGSILRTADGAGASVVYFTGYTPPPVDRFGRSNREIAKTALGAEKGMAWEAQSSLARLVAKLKDEGYLVVAFETGRSAVRYTDIAYRSPVALLFGNEKDGLDRRALALADAVAEIPMHGGKESLNVSVSAGIGLYALREALERTTRKARWRGTGTRRRGAPSRRRG